MSPQHPPPSTSSLQVLLSGFSQTSPHEVCFNISTAYANTVSNATADDKAQGTPPGGPAALLVVLEAGELDGEFSDNVLTLEPCRARGGKRVCFSTADAAASGQGEGGQQGGDGGGGGLLDLEALRGNVTATALNSEGSLWWTGG